MQIVTLLLTLAQIPEVSGTPKDFVQMRIVDVEPGGGQTAKPGQKFTVHYTGWLTNGKKFDSSRDHAEPFTFLQGQRQVIAGWDAGFEGMKVGGKRRLLIPYQMAYGEKGRGEIPPKAELIFDVELLKVEDVTPLSPTKELLVPFNEAAKKYLDLAKAVPEDKLDWRPSSGVRSFREVWLHVVETNKVLITMVKDNPPADVLAKLESSMMKAEKEMVTKAKLIAMLEENFDLVRKHVEPLRAGALAREMTVFGDTATARGMYIMIDTHMTEHLGQSIAYARMNGIKPPWN